MDVRAPIHREREDDGIGPGLTNTPVTNTITASVPAGHGTIGRIQLQNLGGCRTWGVDSENRPQRGHFLPDLQPHGPAMGQKAGEKWTAAVDLQPTLPKSDSLLG